jgi:rfaE bifunctional protein kinase chain/domain
MIQPARLTELFHHIARITVGVIGDFCMDAYWDLDAYEPEISVETGKPTHAVTKQRYFLGGAGNVISNVVALGVRKAFAFGVRADDLFGREMIRQMDALKVDSTGLVRQPSEWDTPAYAKPYLGEEEQNRIDFGRLNKISQESADHLINALDASLSRLDALIINQQLPQSIYTSELIVTLNRLVEQFPARVVLLDSRNRSLEFHHTLYKVNAVEAARLFGKKATDNEDVPLKELQHYASQLFRRFERPVFITRSSLGILLFDGNEYSEIPAVKMQGATDTVGAGDTTLAAIACALAAGSSYAEAATLATYAAAVTVQKLRQTGTANPSEILEIAKGK